MRRERQTTEHTGELNQEQPLRAHFSWMQKLLSGVMRLSFAFLTCVSAFGSLFRSCERHQDQQEKVPKPTPVLDDAVLTKLHAQLGSFWCWPCTHISPKAQSDEVQDAVKGAVDGAKEAARDAAEWAPGFPGAGWGLSG